MGYNDIMLLLFIVLMLVGLPLLAFLKIKFELKETADSHTQDMLTNSLEFRNTMANNGYPIRTFDGVESYKARLKVYSDNLEANDYA